MTREETARLYSRPNIVHSWWGLSPHAGDVELRPGKYRAENCTAIPVGASGEPATVFVVKKAARFHVERGAGHAFLLQEG